MDTSLLDVLKSSQLAAGQTPADLIALVRELSVVTLGAGEVLCTIGEEADAAWLLTLGALEIRAGDGALLDTEHPGAVVGEQALMPGGGGVRNATVVAASEARLLRIGREAFLALLERNRAALEAASEAKTRNRLGKQARPLRALLDRGEQRTWADGEILFREGDASDGMHLVMGGQAEVAIQQGGEPVHIATVYPGQCFGEIGVLQGAPRSATVIARHRLRTVSVPAAEVRALQAAEPELEAFLRGLLRSRELPRLGLVHQHTVIEAGQVCIQTVFSLNDGRELIGLRTPAGHYTLAQAGAAVAETLRVAGTSVSLDEDGRIVGFEDRGDYEDVGGLQVLALEGVPLSRQQRRTLKKAAKAAAELAPDAITCRCLSIERQVIQACIDQGAHTIPAVQEATGVGTGCGGCLRKVVTMFPGAAASAPAPALPRLGPPQKAAAAASGSGGGFFGWLRSALGG